MKPWRYKEPGYTGWHYNEYYCRMMNAVDARYWDCECHYMAPFGLVISADCEKHD